MVLANYSLQQHSVSDFGLKIISCLGEGGGGKIILWRPRGWGPRRKVDMFVRSCPDFRAFFRVSRLCKFERTTLPSWVHLGLDISTFRLRPQPGDSKICKIKKDLSGKLTHTAPRKDVSSDTGRYPVIEEVFWTWTFSWWYITSVSSISELSHTWTLETATSQFPSRVVHKFTRSWTTSGTNKLQATDFTLGISGFEKKRHLKLNRLILDETQPKNFGWNPNGKEGTSDSVFWFRTYCGFVHAMVPTRDLACNLCTKAV